MSALSLDRNFAAYLVFVTLLVLTPGAGTAVVVRHVLRGGGRAGCIAALGTLSGNLTWAIAGGLGITALLARVPATFTIIRVGGGLYLAWLGARGLWTAWRPMRSAATPDRRDAGAPSGTPRAAFTQGLVTNLFSPAVATLYLVALPSFLSAGRESQRFVLFAAIHVIMAFAYHNAWAWTFDALKRTWADPRIYRTFEAITGAALLALALRIACS